MTSFIWKKKRKNWIWCVEWMFVVEGICKDTKSIIFKIMTSIWGWKRQIYFKLNQFVVHKKWKLKNKQYNNNKYTRKTKQNNKPETHVIHFVTSLFVSIQNSWEAPVVMKNIGKCEHIKIYFTIWQHEITSECWIGRNLVNV